MDKNLEQQLPVEFLSGNFSDFEDQFTWILSYNEDTEDVTYSENVLNVTGLDAAELNGMRGNLYNRVHEDDLEQVRKKFNEMLSDNSINHYTTDYRIISK